MNIIKRPDYKPVRRNVKAGLLSYEFIEKYLYYYGHPHCYCCNEIQEKFIPARSLKVIKIYCINCALTTRTVGKCNHITG